MLQIETSQMNSLAEHSFQQRIAALAARSRKLFPEFFAGLTDAEMHARTAAQVAEAEKLGITNQRDVARYIDLSNKSPEVVDSKSPLMNDPRRTPEERMRIAAMRASRPSNAAQSPNPGNQR